MSAAKEPKPASGPVSLGDEATVREAMMVWQQAREDEATTTDTAHTPQT